MAEEEDVDARVFEVPLLISLSSVFETEAVWDADMLKKVINTGMWSRDTEERDEDEGRENKRREVAPLDRAICGIDRIGQRRHLVQIQMEIQCIECGTWRDGLHKKASFEVREFEKQIVKVARRPMEKVLTYI